MSAKTDDLIDMAKTIMKEGDYIDGIGMEAHLDSRYPSASEFEQLYINENCLLV